MSTRVHYSEGVVTTNGADPSVPDVDVAVTVKRVGSNRVEIGVVAEVTHSGIFIWSKDWVVIPCSDAIDARIEQLTSAAIADARIALASAMKAISGNAHE